MTNLLKELRQFTGSEEFYRHNLNPSFVYTEGVQYLAEQAQAYWLVDYIFSYQHLASLKAEPFQTWKLEVAENAGKVTVTDGNKNTLKTLAIEFTDFPLPEITLWLVDKTLMLSSEY